MTSEGANDIARVSRNEQTRGKRGLTRHSVDREARVFYAAQRFADPAKRQRFIERACNGDELMQTKVKHLLAVKGDADAFFAEASSISAIKENPSGEPPLSGRVTQQSVSHSGMGGANSEGGDKETCPAP